MIKTEFHMGINFTITTTFLTVAIPVEVAERTNKQDK
jgi:hypothetical protein